MERNQVDYLISVRHTVDAALASAINEFALDNPLGAHEYVHTAKKHMTLLASTIAFYALRKEGLIQ